MEDSFDIVPLDLTLPKKKKVTSEEETKNTIHPEQLNLIEPLVLPSADKSHIITTSSLPKTKKVTSDEETKNTIHAEQHNSLVLPTADKNHNITTSTLPKMENVTSDENTKNAIHPNQFSHYATTSITKSLTDIDLSCASVEAGNELVADSIKMTCPTEESCSQVKLTVSAANEAADFTRTEAIYDSVDSGDDNSSDSSELSLYAPSLS